MAEPKKKRTTEPGELASLIARARRMVVQAGSRHLESEGESMLAWQLMNGLVRRGPMTQRELATWLGQHPAGICRLLEVLEGEALVVRERETEDRRKIRVDLTAKGRQRYTAMRPLLAHAAEQVLAPLSLDERRTLADLLEKMIGGAEV